MEISYSTKLTELYERDGRKISYEKWIKGLEKQYFLILRDILKVDLELPKFYAVHLGELVKTNEKGRDGIPAAILSTETILNNRKTRVKKIIRVRLGVTVIYDMTLSEFIGCVGHEMVHYYDLVHYKKWPLHHKSRFKRIMRRWNKKLKPYEIYITDGCNTLGKRKEYENDL